MPSPSSTGPSSIVLSPRVSLKSLGPNRKPLCCRKRTDTVPLSLCSVPVCNWAKVLWVLAPGPNSQGTWLMNSDTSLLGIKFFWLETQLSGTREMLEFYWRHSLDWISWSLCSLALLYWFTLDRGSKDPRVSPKQSLQIPQTEWRKDGLIPWKVFWGLCVYSSIDGGPELVPGRTVAHQCPPP